MGWENYTNMFGDAAAAHPKAQGDLIDVTEHEENASGVQAEFEARGAAHSPDLPGVISGMAVSASGATVTIAAGVALVNGLKAVGGTSLTASGATGTYYVYVDPGEADEADAYKVKAAIPDDDELLLHSFVWDGAAVTSQADCREWGIDGDAFTFNTDITTDLMPYLNTVIREWIAPRDLTIRSPHVRVNTCGTGGGPTTFDILTGTATGAKASIYSATGSHPSIAHDDTDGTIDRGLPPDTSARLVSAGSVIQFSAELVATGAAGLSVTIPISYR